MFMACQDFAACYIRQTMYTIRQAAARTGGRPADLTAAVASLSDADREAGAQHRVGGWFFAVLTVAQLVLFAAVVPLLRRARRHARADALRPVPARLVRVVEIALVAAALAIPAALLADAVPWWRSTLAGTLFTLTALALTAGLTVAVVSGPWYRGTLGPAGAVGTVAATVVGLDVVTGARLQLNGVAGYSALDGHRFAGMGTVALGLFCAGVLLVAGTVAQQVARRWRPAVVACLGAVAIVLVGSPYLGADAGGAIALTAGVCVAAAISTGGWLTFARLAWATLAGIAVTTGFALLDLRRPPAEQGSLGRFLAQAQDGTSGAAVHRASVANVAAVTDSPLTLVVLGAAVLVGVAMLAPWGGLKRLFGLRPAIRGALIGLAVATLLGGAVDGAGLRVAGAAVAVAVPVAALAALRVLDHADDRTVAGVAAPVPPGGPVPPLGPVAPDRRAGHAGPAGDGPDGGTAPGDPAAVERDDEPDTDVPPRQRRGDVLL